MQYTKDQRERQESVLMITESTLLKARITTKYRRPNFGQRFNWIWTQDSKMILLLSQNPATSCLSSPLQMIWRGKYSVNWLNHITF